MNILKSNQRGTTQLDWLDSHHSFSFGDYYDPNNTGFGPLRVINDDRIAPGAGFPMHPHREMEIFSYVTEGALAHKDNLGNASQIGPNRVQLMSAGTGIRHSEFNPSSDKSTRLLQIWITPNQPSLAPKYQELEFDPASRVGQLRVLASPDGQNDSMVIRQDVIISTTVLEQNQSLPLILNENRQAWIQVVQGSGFINDQPIQTGDGIQLIEATTAQLRTETDIEIIFFDLPQ